MIDDLTIDCSTVTSMHRRINRPIDASIVTSPIIDPAAQP
jgi:hypothetical protein